MKRKRAVAKSMLQWLPRDVKRMVMAPPPGCRDIEFYRQLARYRQVCREWNAIISERWGVVLDALRLMQTDANVSWWGRFLTGDVMDIDRASQIFGLYHQLIETKDTDELLSVRNHTVYYILDYNLRVMIHFRLRPILIAIRVVKRTEGLYFDCVVLGSSGTFGDRRTVTDVPQWMYHNTHVTFCSLNDQVPTVAELEKAVRAAAF